MAICPQRGNSGVTLVTRPALFARRTVVIVFEQCLVWMFIAFVFYCGFARYCGRVSNCVIRHNSVHTEAENGVSLISLFFLCSC